MLARAGQPLISFRGSVDLQAKVGSTVFPLSTRDPQPALLRCAGMSPDQESLGLSGLPPLPRPFEAGGWVPVDVPAGCA